MWTSGKLKIWSSYIKFPTGLLGVNITSLNLHFSSPLTWHKIWWEFLHGQTYIKLYSICWRPLIVQVFYLVLNSPLLITTSSSDSNTMEEPVSITTISQPYLHLKYLVPLLDIDTLIQLSPTFFSLIKYALLSLLWIEAAWRIFGKVRRNDTTITMRYFFTSSLL